MEKGATVSATTISKDKPQYHDLTPLHGAFLSDFNQREWMNRIDGTMITDIAIVLLEARADPSALPFDKTPMWKNLVCGRLATFHWSVTNDSHRDGNIPVFHTWAGLDYLNTEHSSFAMFKILVDKDVDQLLKDDEGFTPLALRCCLRFPWYPFQPTSFGLPPGARHQLQPNGKNRGHGSGQCYCSRPLSRRSKSL